MVALHVKRGIVPPCIKLLSPLSLPDGELNHVYAYGTPNSTEEWVLRSQVSEPHSIIPTPPASSSPLLWSLGGFQLVQFQQYRCLFEGFQAHMWQYYSAVVFWKSQSPWPVLRGAFYDTFLVQTGGFYGVKAAVSEKVHAQLHLPQLSVDIVNKGLVAVRGSNLTVGFYSLKDGSAVGSLATQTIALLPSNALSDNVLQLTWPNVSDNTVLLVRLRLTMDGPCTGSIVDSERAPFPTKGSTCTLSYNEYWLTRPSFELPQKYDELGLMRAGGSLVALQVNATVAGFPNENNMSRVVVTVQHVDVSAAPAFMSRVQLHQHQGKDDTRVAPAWYSTNYFTLLPGERSQLVVEAQLVAQDRAWVVVDGWNVKPVISVLVD